LLTASWRLHSRDRAGARDRRVGGGAFNRFRELGLEPRLSNELLFAADFFGAGFRLAVSRLSRLRGLVFSPLPFFMRRYESISTNREKRIRDLAQVELVATIACAEPKKANFDLIVCGACTRGLVRDQNARRKPCLCCWSLRSCFVAGCDLSAIAVESASTSRLVHPLLVCLRWLTLTAMLLAAFDLLRCAWTLEKGTNVAGKILATGLPGIGAEMRRPAPAAISHNGWKTRAQMEATERETLAPFAQKSAIHAAANMPKRAMNTARSINATGPASSLTRRFAV